MNKKTKILNPWKLRDEQEHKKSAIEWWCIEAFLKNKKNKKKWNLKGSISQWKKRDNKPGSNILITLFDLDKKKNYDYYSKNEKQKLKTSKKNIKFSFEDSYIKGKYPNYEIFLKDKKNNIEIKLKYKAESLPHWISQETTDGWLPMGLGFYRYGFIPKCKVSGTLKIKNEKYEIIGNGYYEHVWGNFSYTNWFTYNRNIEKSITTYIQLLGRWIHSNKPNIPKSLILSNDNNPLGYDWIWAVLDNGWTIFYGNILGWIMKGPVFGTVILSKDGGKYTEFYNANFEYKKIKYSKKYDMYYPREISLKFKDKNETFKLDFKPNTYAHEFLLNLSDKKNAFVVYEQPGIVDGFCKKEGKKINLKGICKMEPQRQLLSRKHKSLKIDFLLPPKGFGFSITFNSHDLNKIIKTKMHLSPKFSFDLNIKKTNKESYDISDVDSLFKIS